jgi:hypothetical protein
MEYHYHAKVRQELLSKGIKITKSTPPELARLQLNDLYRFEIRQLRQRFRHGEIARSEYAHHVISLRRRYPLLSLPTSLWTRSHQTDSKES